MATLLVPFLPPPGRDHATPLTRFPILFPPPCSTTLHEHSPREIQDQAPLKLPSRVAIVLTSEAALPQNLRPSPQLPNPSSGASWGGGGIGIHSHLRLQWGTLMLFGPLGSTGAKPPVARFPFLQALPDAVEEFATCLFVPGRGPLAWPAFSYRACATPRIFTFKSRLRLRSPAIEDPPYLSR